jgi:hypothetical protein
MVATRRWTSAVRAWLAGVGLLLPVLALATAAHAQGLGGVPAGSHPPTKTYMNKNVFYLPVIIDERVRHNLREVQLYVKDNPTRPWMLKEKAPATQTGFTYRGMQDGEYWFTVVTVDRAGRMMPADLGSEPPGLIVVLDTHNPQVSARPLPSSRDGMFVRCEVRDANPDPMKTRLEYQTGDKQWRVADPLPNQMETFMIPQQAMFTGMVRVSATDRAGNTASREFDMGALAAAMNPPAGTSGQKTEMPAEDPVVKSMPSPVAGAAVVASTSGTPEAMTAEKCGPALQPCENSSPRPAMPSSPAAVAQAVYQTPDAGPPPCASAPPRQTAANLTRQLVNNSHVFLEYQIEQMGPSGVGKVEVWITKDQGQSWQRLGEDANRKSPVEIDLPGEGLFGVSLVVTNGRGFGGTPPSPGDAPDWWIEVDVTKPTAEILAVQPAFGQDDGGLVITWTARDKNLGAEPIDLYYGISREGPWQTIAKGLKNEGHYRWAVPTDVGAHAFLRLVASDKAGNVTQVETTQPVALDDLSRPRGRVVGVATTGPRLTPPSGN